MCWLMSTQNPKHNSSISSPINRFRRFLLFKLSDSSLIFNSQITVLLQVKIKYKSKNRKLDWTQHLFRTQLNGDSTQSILNNYYHFPHFVDSTVKFKKNLKKGNHLIWGEGGGGEQAARREIGEETGSRLIRIRRLRLRRRRLHGIWRLNNPPELHREVRIVK